VGKQTDKKIAQGEEEDERLLWKETEDCSTPARKVKMTQIFLARVHFPLRVRTDA
jgi:hypothetical protein